MSHDNGNNGSGDRLFRTMAAVLGVDQGEFSDSSSPETISTWDSLNHLNVIMAMEEEFGVELTPDDAMNMAEVARIRAVLRGYGVEV